MLNKKPVCKYEVLFYIYCSIDSEVLLCSPGSEISRWLIWKFLTFGIH